MPATDSRNVHVIILYVMVGKDGPAISQIASSDPCLKRLTIVAASNLLADRDVPSKRWTSIAVSDATFANAMQTSSHRLK